MLKFCRFLTRCYILTVLLLSNVYADTESEQEIKAGFILNFAKYVTWPRSGSASAPLVICVIAPSPLLAKISLLKYKKINARPVEVQVFNSEKTFNSCDVLFLSEIETKQLERVLTIISSQPVLTVSDKPNFAQEGGMIGMKEQDNRLRFDINLAIAKKAGLTISSQLLGLADEVIQ